MPDDAGLVLGDPAAAGVGAPRSGGCARSRPRGARRSGADGRGLARPAHAGVELEEALVADPLGGRHVVGGHRPDRQVSHAATVGGGDNGRMRVLVAPDKFAGTLTAVEAAEAIADGLAAAGARTTSSTWRRWPTAARASSTCCTPRSAASCSRSRSAARTASRRRRRSCVDGEHGVRRERAGVRPAPDRRARAPRPRRRTASASWSSPRSTPGATRIVVGLGGSGTNDGGAGPARPRSARPPTGRSTRGAAGLAGITAGRACPAVATSSWSRPATWTTR